MSAIEHLRQSLAPASPLDALAVALTPESAKTQPRTEGGQFGSTGKSAPKRKSSKFKPRFLPKPKAGKGKKGKGKKGGKGKAGDQPKEITDTKGKKVSIKASEAAAADKLTTPQRDKYIEARASGLNHPDAMATVKKQTTQDKASTAANDRIAKSMAKLHVPTSSRPTPPPP